MDFQPLAAHSKRFFQQLHLLLLAESRRSAEELGRDVREQFDTKGSGFFNSGNRLRVSRDSRLYRATMPGQPGNIFRLSGNIATNIVAYTEIDGGKVPEIVHERGKTIKAGPQTVKALFRLWYETGEEGYKATALKVKRTGKIKLQRRPFWAPGVRLWKMRDVPTSVRHVAGQIATIWERTR